MHRKIEKRLVEKKIKLAKNQQKKLDNKNTLAGIVASKYALLKNEKGHC
jgi:beta-glucosidase-like glycosyl hydrolase